MSGVKLNGCGMVTLSCFIREEVQMVKVALVLGDALLLGTKTFSLFTPAVLLIISHNRMKIDENVVMLLPISLI